MGAERKLIRSDQKGDCHVQKSSNIAVQLRNEFKEKYPTWAQPIRVHPAATVIYAELP